MQIPIGAEEKFEGVIDLLKMKAYKFEGEMGKEVIEFAIPESYKSDAAMYRAQLVEKIVEPDDRLLHDFLEGKEP